MAKVYTFFVDFRLRNDKKLQKVGLFINHGLVANSYEFPTIFT